MATGTIPPQTIEPRPEFAAILRDRETFAGSDAGGTAEKLNRWYDRLLIQSGIETAPSLVLLGCIALGVTLGGLAFVIQEDLLTTGIAAVLGSSAPIAAIAIRRLRRQARILEQMPAMIDELARAARTGRSLDQCLELVAADTPAPLGSELQLCVRKLKLGVTLSEALDDLPERTGVATMNVLAMALAVHQQTGGDIVRVLERLSRTIRDRLQFFGRLRAATAASRATSLLMIGLPPAILTFFVFRDPDYFARLMSSVWGRAITVTAVLLQLVGSVWVLRILRNSRRT